MPLTFPSHPGLILPAVRRWPNHFDALALSVGAAMPDIADTALGFVIHGYFKQGYGHSLIGAVTIDILGGLLITGLITVFAASLLKRTDLPQWLRILFTNEPPKSESAAGRNEVRSSRTMLSLWSFSMLVGIFSHLAFDLITHETTLLFYPWYDNLRLFPEWWYKIWFEIYALPMFGNSYSVGSFTVMWGILTLLGIFLFFRYLSQKYKSRM
jgi:hypothetical protein